MNRYSGIINRMRACITVVLMFAIAGCAGMESVPSTRFVGSDRIASPAKALKCNVRTPSSHRNLFVANDGGGKVLEFAPPFKSAPKVLTSVPNPVAVAFDNKKDLFVSVYGANQVQVFRSPYKKPFAKTTFSIVQPYGIALDGHNNLFVANSSQNRVVEFVPPYTRAPKLIITSGISDPNSVAFDDKCNLFVTNQGTNTFLEFAPPYNAAPIASGGLGMLGAPTGIAVDASRNVYVDNFNSGTVLEFKPPYKKGAKTITTATEPNGIAFYHDWNFYSCNYGDNNVAE